MKGMENQLAIMEEQLRFYNVQYQLRPTHEEQENVVSHPNAFTMHPNALNFTNTMKSTDNNPEKANNWQLTVSGGSEGISLQTSIKSLADVSAFLTNTFQYFNSYPLPRTPNYHIDRSLQVLTVTNRMLSVESLLYSFFQSKKKMAEDSLVLNSIPFYDHFTRMVVKGKIIDSYYTCMGMLNPLFPKTHFYPIFRANQHAMLTSAMVAFVTYTQCRHVPVIPAPMTRELLGESFRKEAKDLLEDVLFEQEPNIYIAATLMFLSQCALMTLNNSEARLYMNMAWRMILELKPRHVHVLAEITPDTPFSVERVEAETWRRLFYVIRYLELSLYVLYDGLYDYSSILFDSGIGYPTVLSIEKTAQDTIDSVEAFREVVRVNDCQLTRKDDEIRYRLFTGKLDNVSVHELQRLESQLCDFWKSLPPSFQLSDSPFDYLQMDRIQQCDNPYAIYLHQVYYSYWLALETRLMEEPSATDLEGTNMDRYDGDRALLLVSICSDAMSKIFHILFRKLPCNVEMHWMLIAADAMGRLKKSANPGISARASINLQQTLAVLKRRVQKTDADGNLENDNYSMLKSMLPSVQTPSGSMSTSTSSSSLAGSEQDSLYGDDSDAVTDSTPSNEPSAYIVNLQKAISTHLDDKEFSVV
ncbi:hypothetical protein G6F56_002167 [Rhizopus delemar]|uniref:Transcription factor domain-containing protein n=1 Tax=Rhizopus stolonifer TaxID=4846 RepID=A0A367J7R2_RHIST|nr:hypothetical protein G6F56_002167 [Rhizopus delemar]RCH86002.1 hypothetical protein CU098_005104 [Rhizopus stolonifer]